MLPELKIPQNDEFLELEKAEQALIDSEIIKKIHETIGVSDEYNVTKITKDAVDVEVRVR
jgi:hypothetical protein